MIDRHYRVVALVDGQVEQQFLLAISPVAAMMNFREVATARGSSFGDLPLLLVAIHEITFGADIEIYTDATWALDAEFKRADMQASRAALLECRRKDPFVVSIPELEMHRSDYAGVRAAGFESPGELLAAYERLRRRLEELGGPDDSHERDAHAFTKGLHEVWAGFDEPAFVGQPESWIGKEFARISYHSDRGDPSVGIPARCGWTLAENQAGTTLEDLVKPAFYVVHVEGDIDPYLYGPYATVAERDMEAGKLRLEYEDDGLYGLDVINGLPIIGSWSGGQMDEMASQAAAN